MQHLDPELLSLLALDERVGTAAEREHLHGCTLCGHEYDVLRRTVSVARTEPQQQALQSPGPRVWAAIHRELGLDASLSEDPLGGAVQDIRPAPAPLSENPGGAAGPGRRHRRIWLLAAAAALVIVLGIGWAVSRQAAQPAPVAVAQLAPLKHFTATGSAEVLETGSERELLIRLSADQARGYQEVWLLKPDLSGLVSLGVMESTTGTFAIPPGLNLADYPIVDVSDEPLDGRPAHSGVSIVRGKLDI